MFALESDVSKSHVSKAVGTMLLVYVLVPASALQQISRVVFLFIILQPLGW